MFHPRYSPALLGSVLLHGLILSLFIISFEMSSRMPVVENSDKDMKVITAVVMDTPNPSVALPAPTPPSPAKVKPAPLKPVEKIKPISVPDAIALKAQHQKEVLKQKELIAKQLLDDVKKQAALQKKVNAKNLEAAFAKELKEQSQKALQQQISKEDARLAGAKVQGEVNKYKALILQAISREWLVPASVNKKLASTLLIRLAPDGSVLDVQVTHSSGDAALDRSARDAVFKASPLPVPSASEGFDQFRQFVLRVKPENIIAADAG